MGITIKKQTKQWTTRDGKKIRLCDMEDQHLLNSIRYLEKRSRACALMAGFKALQAASFFNGEMAQLSAENAADRYLLGDGDDDFLPPIYDNMIEEAIRRGVI